MPVMDYPLAYLKYVAGRPSDPRYIEVLGELNRREESPSIPIITDDVVEGMLFHPSMSNLADGTRLRTLRMWAATALAGQYLPGEEGLDREVSVRERGLNWRFRLIGKDAILIEVKEGP